MSTDYLKIHYKCLGSSFTDYKTLNGELRTVNDGVYPLDVILDIDIQTRISPISTSNTTCIRILLDFITPHLFDCNIDDLPVTTPANVHKPEMSSSSINGPPLSP